MDQLYSKNIDDIHIINTITSIEGVVSINSLIQEQLLPTLGAVVWIWYWQEDEKSPLEIISVVNSKKGSSSSVLNFDGQLIADNIFLISSNKAFGFQGKVALLALLKKHSSTNVKNSFSMRYKAIVRAPKLIGFA